MEARRVTPKQLHDILQRERDTPNELYICYRSGYRFIEMKVAIVTHIYIFAILVSRLVFYKRKSCIKFFRVEHSFFSSAKEQVMAQFMKNDYNLCSAIFTWIDVKNETQLMKLLTKTVKFSNTQYVVLFDILSWNYYAPKELVSPPLSWNPTEDARFLPSIEKPKVEKPKVGKTKMRKKIKKKRKRTRRRRT